MNPDALVIAERQGAVSVLTLNRPSARNALNPALIDHLAAALHMADKDPAVHAVLLRGNGPHFCAGIDLKSAWPSTIPELVQDGIGGREAPFRLRKPLVAAVSGAAVGAGFEMLLAADLILIDKTARFALPEFGFGALPVTGALSRLTARIGSGRTADLLFSGRTLDAAEAVEWGLARMAEGDDLHGSAMAIATKIASQPLHVGLLAKQALSAAQATNGHEAERQLAFAAFSTRSASR